MLLLCLFQALPRLAEIDLGLEYKKLVSAFLGKLKFNYLSAQMLKKKNYIKPLLSLFLYKMLSVSRELVPNTLSCEGLGKVLF